MAAGIDLDGDGREDLLVGGCSYQGGIPGDPHPGAGVYCLFNRGTDPASGLPVLSPPHPVQFQGFDPGTATNKHVHIQTLDVDGDGIEEAVIVFEWKDPNTGYVFKVASPGAGAAAILCVCGYTIPMNVQEWLLDIDGDGKVEIVFAGNENGVGHYRKLRRIQHHGRIEREAR